MSICHDEERGLYCIACCGISDEIKRTSDLDRYAKALDGKIKRNTEQFEGKTQEEKIALAIKRYYQTNKGIDPLCGNVVYLSEGVPGCAIHPNVLGVDERPCIIVSGCNTYTKSERNPNFARELVESTQKMEWAEYSAHMGKKVNVFSILLAHVRQGLGF